MFRFKFFIGLFVFMTLSVSARAGFFDDMKQAVWEGEAEAVVPNTATSTRTDLAADMPGDELWSALRSEARFQWGQTFDPKDVRVDLVDVTCDGKYDYVASMISQDNPDGPFFQMIVASDHEGNDLRTESISLPFTGSSEQYGLCLGEFRNVETFYDVWPQEEIDEFVGVDVCAVPVGVSDGMCNSPYFFWFNEAKADESRLVFFRH